MGVRTRQRECALMLGACVVAVFSWLASAQVAEGAEPPPSVSLGEGHIGRFLWAAQVEAPEIRGEKGICLSVFTLGPTPTRTAEGNDVTQCGSISSTTPMVESFTGGRRHKRRTARAYAGSFCIKRFIAYGASGAVVVDSGHLECFG